jgi:hypothetical protein
LELGRSFLTGLNQLAEPGFIRLRQKGIPTDLVEVQANQILVARFPSLRQASFLSTIVVGINVTPRHIDLCQPPAVTAVTPAASARSTPDPVLRV